MYRVVHLASDGRTAARHGSPIRHVNHATPSHPSIEDRAAAKSLKACSSATPIRSELELDTPSHPSIEDRAAHGNVHAPPACISIHYSLSYLRGEARANPATISCLLGPSVYKNPRTQKRPRRAPAFQAPLSTPLVVSRLLAPSSGIIIITGASAQSLRSRSVVMGDDDAHRLLRQGGCCWVSGTTTSSLFSSTSSLTDDDRADDATFCSTPSCFHRPASSSSLTSPDQHMQMDGAATVPGPLYELSTMLDHLPSLRTGLSGYYRGRSQSFTSLADVSCVEDLAKKTAPSYIRRRSTKQASRRYAAALGVSNKVLAKKVQSSPRNTGLLRRSTSNRPPAYN